MNAPEQPWGGSPHAKHTNAYSLLPPLDTKPGFSSVSGFLSNCPVKVIANAFSAGFHLIVQRARPPPVGSNDLVTRYKALHCCGPVWGNAREPGQPAGRER